MDPTDAAAEFDWLTVEEGEEVLWADTPHPYSLVPALVVGVPLAVVLVGLVVIVGAYLGYQNTNYVVTSAALYKKTGVLSRSVQRIEFDKVQDTSYRQSFLGAQFGYGTVDVSTAGGSGVEMSFENVADPLAVQSHVNERIRETGGRGPEAERGADEVLDAILDELRAIRRAIEGRPASPETRAEGAADTAGGERTAGDERAGGHTDASAADPGGDEGTDSAPDGGAGDDPGGP